MGLATIDPHSLKDHTEIYKIPKFGVNRPNVVFQTMWINRRVKLSPEEKRKESKANPGNASKKFKSASDVQLFRGKTFYLLCDVSRWVGLSEHPTIIPLVLYFYSI